MKTKIILLIACALITGRLTAQIEVARKFPKIEVCESKTSNITFPYAILSVDRGSKEVLAQKAKGVENILLVKAAGEFFHETNLTVVTADGQVSSLSVVYREFPQQTTYSLSGGRSEMIRLSPGSYNEQVVRSKARAAFDSRQKVGNLSVSGGGISFQMNGIFVHENVLFMRIRIVNNSNLQYDIDQLRYFIVDQKRARRTASQEIEILPVYIDEALDCVKAGSVHTMVFALPKFTIPDEKDFTVQLMERNGGRHFKLKVSNRRLMAARPL